MRVVRNAGWKRDAGGTEGGGRKERNQLLFARNVVRGKWRTEGWPDVMAPLNQPRLLPSGIRSVSIVPLHLALPVPPPSSHSLSPFLSLRSERACLCPPIYWRVFAPLSNWRCLGRELNRKSSITADLDMDEIVESKKIC